MYFKGLHGNFLLFVNQNLRTGRPEPEIYNFSNPPNTDCLIFINLKHVIYDIGTEILCKTCFGHNSTQNERKSMIFSGSCTEFYVHCESAIKTRFKALFKNRQPWIRNYRFGNYNILAPAGILREPFYKIFQRVGPCGHIKRALLQNIPIV